MEPSSIGARLASSAVIPLVKKLFITDGPGAELVDKPVRISRLVSFRGEQRSLTGKDLHHLATELVRQAVRAAPPGERPVPPAEDEAVAHALAGTLSALGGITMDDVQAVQLGHQAFARELYRMAPGCADQLSSDGTRLHRRLTDTAALHILNFLTQRSTFVARTLVEQSRQLDHLVTAVDLLVERHPSPLARDTAFERRYADYVVRRHNELTIYGLDLSHPREWPLDAAYLSLEAGTAHAAPVRAERVFDRHDRILLSGAAGSGKTTLVQWLAISAARGPDSHHLPHLIGRVPFVLPLRTIARGDDLPTPDRFLTAVRCPLAGAQPEGWTDRVLAAGRALLLVDGVDEVPRRRQEETRRWLRELLGTYPGNLWLVTSRPSAVRTDWLAPEHFGELELTPMSRHDITAFVRRWHHAAGAPPKLAESFLSTVRAKQELGRLATNPLMCAVMCALHRERRGFLPLGRKELYDAALSTLLERRDIERNMHPEELRLAKESQIVLLQKLAHWLVRNGRSEMEQTDAVGQLALALRQMPHVVTEPEQVYRYLLMRSGLLREPTAETVDFVHRTFQDYLGAKAVVEEGDFPMLENNAHNEQWEDVVRMAVAHARPQERSRILGALIDTSSAGEPLSLRRTLLAAACLEHATEVDPALHAEITDCARHFIPPPDVTVARMLAEVGGPVALGLLPGPEGLTDAQAEAVVVAATRIATDAAVPLLARYRRHPSLQVRRQLTWAWHRFDPELYAEEIIAHLPEEGLFFSVSVPEHLVALHKLGGRARIQLRDHDLCEYLLKTAHRDRLTHLWITDALPPYAELGWLSAFPNLCELRLFLPPSPTVQQTAPPGLRIVPAEPPDARPS